ELFRLWLHRSRDRKFLFALSQSSVTTEERYLPGDRPAGAWKVILPRETDHEYHAEHRGGLVYLRPNKGARGFRLVTAAVGDPPGPARWKQLVPHRPGVLLQNVAFFARHAVLSEWDGGLPQLRVLDFATAQQHAVAFPEPAYAVQPELNPEFDAKVFRYRYQ